MPGLNPRRSSECVRLSGSHPVFRVTVKFSGFENVDAGVRSAIVISVAASYFAWDIGFDFGVYGTIFFDKVFLVWSISFALLMIFIIIPKKILPVPRSPVTLGRNGDPHSLGTGRAREPGCTGRDPVSPCTDDTRLCCRTGLLSLRCLRNYVGDLPRLHADEQGCAESRHRAHRRNNGTRRLPGRLVS